MKRALSSLLVFALVLTLLVPAFAFAADKTTEEKFNELKEKGLLNGVEDGSAALDRELTRAELAAILVRLFKLEPITGQSSFIDVPAEHWAQKEGVIEAVAKAGLMGSTTTYSKTFSPDAKLTIAEVAKVAVSALKLTVDENAKIDGVQTWAAPYVDAALKAGLIAEAKDYHANANRGILVDAAYVIYTTVINPVTGATKVESVKADNLKQVVVTFDGTVDQDSAENIDNYSIDGVDFEYAELQEDGKTVVLTLAKDETVKFDNQKQVKISIDNIKNTEGKYVAKVDDLAFTPVDVTIPTVKEINSLGTKAFEVVFSEPIKESTARTLLAYKVDGKSIGGTVKYNFPNSVVVETNLSTGDHTLSVSNVEDFNQFKVNASNLAFTIAEDKEAPTIVSAKSIDLTKVVVELSEPVKSLSKAYHTNSNLTGSFTISGKKVTITFGETKRLSLNSNTVYLVGVEDYSGNKADLNTVVIPELDKESPTVTKVKAYLDTALNRHYIDVTFSKDVQEADAQNGANYTLKDSSGKPVTGLGLNSKGQPVAQLQYDKANRTATIELYGKLVAGTYTLEVSGIQDTAYVKNTMIPYSTQFTIGDTDAPEIKNAWVESKQVGTKYETSIYVQFSKQMATDGNGSVYEVNKYNYTTSYDSTKSWVPIPLNSTIDFVTLDTIKITLPKTDTDLYNMAATGDATTTKLGIRISTVTDASGNYLGGSLLVADYPVIKKDAVTIAISSAVATANDTVKVKFAGVLSDIVATDFVVTDGTNSSTVKLNSYEYDNSGNTIAYFTLNTPLKADATFTGTNNAQGTAVTFKVGVAQAEVKSMNVFGAKVSVNSTPTVSDAIKAEAQYYGLDSTAKKPFKVETVSAGVYAAKVTFNEALEVRGSGVVDIVAVKLNGAELVVNSIDFVNGDLVIEFTNVKKSNGATVEFSDNLPVEVSLNPSNDDSKVIVDTSFNPVEVFNLSAPYSQVK